MSYQRMDHPCYSLAKYMGLPRCSINAQIQNDRRLTRKDRLLKEMGQVVDHDLRGTNVTLSCNSDSVGCDVPSQYMIPT